MILILNILIFTIGKAYSQTEKLYVPVIPVESFKLYLKNNEIRRTPGIGNPSILDYFGKVSASKYKFLTTFNTGTFVGNPNEGNSSNFLLNGRFSYFYSDNKNIGGDLSLIFLKKAYNYEDTQSTLAFQNQTFIDLLANTQIGTFDVRKLFEIYLNLGFGIHTQYISSYTNSYYSYNDSSYVYSNTPSSFTVYPLLQIGGGFMIKPSKNFALNFETDIKMYSFEYLIIPKEAFFPVKLGISYFFYE